MYLDVLGKFIIIFNSFKPAYDMLERRASNFSGRPRQIVANEILNRDLGMGLMDHSKP
jgi:hypothetical protein